MILISNTKIACLTRFILSIESRRIMISNQAKRAGKWVISSRSLRKEGKTCRDQRVLPEPQDREAIIRERGTLVQILMFLEIQTTISETLKIWERNWMKSSYFICLKSNNATNCRRRVLISIRGSGLSSGPRHCVKWARVWCGKEIGTSTPSYCWIKSLVFRNLVRNSSRSHLIMGICCPRWVKLKCNPS